MEAQVNKIKDVRKSLRLTQFDMAQAAGELERRLNAITPCGGILVAVELDESRPAPTQRGDEGQ